MKLEFTVIVDSEKESVPYIKELILGVLRTFTQAKVVFTGEAQGGWFEENEIQAVERGELSPWL